MQNKAASELGLCDCRCYSLVISHGNWEVYVET